MRLVLRETVNVVSWESGEGNIEHWETKLTVSERRPVFKVACYVAGNFEADRGCQSLLSQVTAHCYPVTS